MRQSAVIWVMLLNLVLAGCTSPNNDLYSGEDISPNKAYRNFELIDSNNTTFNSSSIEGRVIVVNFFLTNCHDACSFITVDLKSVYEEFSFELEDNLTFLSITVDPWRDGPTDLIDYMNYFNTSWTYLTTDDFVDGNFSSVEQIWSDFGITVVLTESENSTSIEGRGHTVYYDVEHTNGIVIVGKDGLQRVRWSEDNWNLDGIKSDLELILQE